MTGNPQMFARELHDSGKVSSEKRALHEAKNLTPKFSIYFANHAILSNFQFFFKKFGYVPGVSIFADFTV